MKNTLGNALTLTLFGESHGPYIGAVVDGLAPGIEVNEEDVRHALDMRRPSGKISTARREADEFTVTSGVFRGKTTGTPLCIIIKNENAVSSDYEYGPARPGHADFAAHEKYHGFEDFRGGGHFSGRVTAAIVAACAVVRAALKKKGILVGTHISNLCSIRDRGFMNYADDIEFLYNRRFPTLMEEAEQQMRSAAERCASLGDSLGGMLETVIVGVPAGAGEPFFGTVEGEISKAMFAIPAVKGVSFGLGFDFVNVFGSEANDEFHYENGKVVFDKNSNGGVNGGITNGAPILFKTIIKPTPSIYKPQKTVDFVKEENIVHTIRGRHDPMIIHRAAPVVDALAAFTVADILTVRYGDDWLFCE